MKMKVAYIVSRFPHLPETFILREMIALEQMDFDIELFPLIVQKQKVIHMESKPWMRRLHHFSLFSLSTLGANMRTMLQKPLRYFSTLFQIIWGNLHSLKFLLRALYIFPVAVRMADETKVMGIEHIHAHYATHPALAALIISKLTSIPFSITVHAHDIFVNRTMLLPKLKEAVFIRAISDFNKQYLIDIYGGWLANKIYVVHCGIQLNKYETAHKKIGEDFRIISIGSLQEYKGHIYLIEACKALTERGIPYQCRIVGEGELRDPLNKFIRALGISGQVELMGPKTEDEVVALLAEVECFVLPSVVTRKGKMEGIPVVLMEALANKLPVIASNISGIPELIVDGITGLLVPQRDSRALAEKMIWVSKNRNEASKMAESGYQKVKDAFNIEKVIVQLQELFIKYHK